MSIKQLLIAILIAVGTANAQPKASETKLHQVALNLEFSDLAWHESKHVATASRLSLNVNPFGRFIRAGESGTGMLPQLLFRSNTAPSFIPKLGPDHSLTNSLFTDDGSAVHLGALSIDSSGDITFAPGQMFPAPGGGGTSFLPLSGGTLTGALTGTSASYSGEVQATSFAGDGSQLTSVNATALNGLQAAAFQLRVASACPTGEAIASIYSNGSLNCVATSAAPPQPTPPGKLSTLNSTTTAVTIGEDGMPLLAFNQDSAIYSQTGANVALLVAHCGDLACSTATTTVLDNTNYPNIAGQIVGPPSVTLGADGNPVISYYIPTGSLSGMLKVAHCVDPLCGNPATISTVDGSGNAGQYSSIAIGAYGNPIISYYNNVNNSGSGELRIAYCQDKACANNPAIYTVDSANNAGLGTSLAINSDVFGSPIISYVTQSSSGTELRLAVCGPGEGSCVLSNVAALGGGSGISPMATYISIGSDGVPVFTAATDPTIAAAVFYRCSDNSCSTITSHNLSASNQLFPAGLAIAPDGYPSVLALGNGSGEMVYLHCLNYACTSFINSGPFLSAQSFIYAPSLVIGSDKLPFFALGTYGYDPTLGQYEAQITTFHCVNNSCTYSRQR